ncbi:MAG TPA: arginine repressor [Candidatus Binatia bacterium]|nr:arginine repressor [Candidatus Binatia bacterium]
MERPLDGTRGTAGGRAARRARQQLIRRLIAEEPIGSQQQLAERLAEHGFEVTQATVSRDIAELGLVKVVRGDRHVYASPLDLARSPGPDDSMLRRVLVDVPVDVRRSGLILLLVSTPGTASIIAEAIDRSSFPEPVGTVAGDNTVLVLFPDEPSLERWRERLQDLQAAAPAQTANGRR